MEGTKKTCIWKKKTETQSSRSQKALEREHSCTIGSWSFTQTHAHALTLTMSNEGAGSFITSIPSHRQAEAVTGWGFVFKGGELLWWELPSVSPFCSPSACALFYCLCPDSLGGMHLSIPNFHSSQGSRSFMSASHWLFTKNLNIFKECVALPVDILLEAERNKERKREIYSVSQTLMFSTCFICIP